MPSGLSAFSELGSTLKQAVEGAVAAARLDNSVDAPQQQPAVWEERQALKPLLKGALLELEGVEGTFAFVPPGRTLVSREGGDVLTVFSDVGPAKERDETWLNANVKTAWLGICTIEGKAGARAALKVANIPATVSPVAATPITMAVVTVGGSAQQPQEIVKALKQLGLSGQGRPWGGGAQGVALVAADGVPKADDAAAIMISATAFVGGGAFAASTVASLVTLGLEVVDGNVQCGRAARIMCAVADAGGLASELAVALATTESAAAGGDARPADLPPRPPIAASPPQAGVAALAAGATSFTHLYNAMSPLHHREPGIVGAALAHAKYAELIPDLLHVHPGAMRVALRSIPCLYCVTDSTAAAGMPDGEYKLGSHTVTKCLGGVRLADGTLAGSFTDGDLRRMLDRDIDIRKATIDEVMVAQPITIEPGHLAAEALQIMETRKINGLMVCDKDHKPLGAFNMQDLLRAGVV
mgnify:CR=1 FL=1